MTAELLSWRRENGYALSPEMMKYKVTELLQERPPEGEFRQVCYEFDGNDRYSDVARTIERQSFEEAFGNDASKMEAMYGPYEAQSRFILNVDSESREALGAIRIIENGPAGLMTLNDLGKSRGVSPEDMPEFIRGVCRQHGIADLNKCRDIGTVAVPPEHRLTKGNLASIQLYRGMYVAAMTAGTEHFISMIDKNAHRILVKFLGIPFEPLGGAEMMEYEGSKATYPVYGDAHEFLKAANRKKHELMQKFGERGMPQQFERIFAVLVDGEGDSAYQFAINNETLTLK